MNTHGVVVRHLDRGWAANERSGARLMSRALSVAAWALLETVARFTLVSLLLVTLAIRVAVLAALFAVSPRAAPDVTAAALGRFPDPPSESPGIATSDDHR